MSATKNLHANATDEQVKAVTEAFLRWRRPLDFNPDGGISFKQTGHWPTGTNLLTYRQAENMVLSILDAL